MTSLRLGLGPRVSVIGCSGAGKTWTSSRLAQRLGVPHVELDSIRHGPNWTETPDDQFQRIVAERTSVDAWVVDGNYESIVRDVIWSRATDVVWLDYSRARIMRQVSQRSFGRVLLRKQLWNGNRERLRDFVRWYHPIRWAWEQHSSKRERDGSQLASDTWSHLRVTRLLTPKQAEHWLTTVFSVHPHTR